jgi:hypothetical protein
MADVRAVVESYSGRIRDPHIFFHPTIPANKLQNAILEYATVDPADVLALYDDTVGGSAKGGAVLTSTALCVRNTLEGSRKVDLADIHDCFFDTKRTIHINGDKFLTMSVCSKDARQLFFEMLHEIAGTTTDLPETLPETAETSRETPVAEAPRNPRIPEGKGECCVCHRVSSEGRGIHMVAYNVSTEVQHGHVGQFSGTYTDTVKSTYAGFVPFYVWFCKECCVEEQKRRLYRSWIPVGIAVACCVAAIVLANWFWLIWVGLFLAIGLLLLAFRMRNLRTRQSNHIEENDILGEWKFKGVLEKLAHHHARAEYMTESEFQTKFASQLKDAGL